MQRVVSDACCSADSMSTLLALVDDAVVIADLDGRIVGWSHGAEQFLGYAPAEIFGRDCADVYAEDERIAHRERCRSLLLGASPASFDATVMTRAGSLHPARVDVALMYDTNGAPRCLLSNIRSGVDAGVRPDVSLSRVREYSVLLDYAPLGLWHLDGNRRFIYANRAAVAMLGSNNTEFVGRHVRDVLGESAYQQLLPALDDAMQGSEAACELQLPDDEPESRHCCVHLLPRRGADGSGKGCFAAVMDITSTRQAQEGQLRRERLLRATLVREINHRIKNSLQGLIGLMRLQAAKRASAQDVVDQSVAQLMAVAVAFGLASRHGDAQILLCDLVSDIAGNLEQTSQRRIQVELSPAAVREPVALSEQYGANISLVINELVFNAIKHSATAEGRRGVRVSVDRDKESAVLRVVNEAGSLPNGFCYDSGTELGTGLSLIKVLVPPDYSRLTISSGSEGVCAELTLRSPVLCLPVHVTEGDRAGPVA